MMNGVKDVVLALAFAAVSAVAWGMDVYVAPVAMIVGASAEDESRRNVASDLWTALGKQYLAPPLRLRRVKGTAAPRSLLEALRLCQRDGLPYLVYGYVRKTDLSYTAELKLVDGATKGIQQVFIASDAPDRYDRLVEELAGKLASYFTDELGFSRYDPERGVRRNLWSGSAALGYWSPAGGAWDEALAGILAVDAGVRLTPKYPSFVAKSRPWYVSAEGAVGYALGMNEADKEASLLHSAILRFGASLSVEPSPRYRIAVGAGPAFRFDVVVQSQKYGETTTSLSAVPAAYAALLWAYRLSERLDLEAELLLEDAWYRTPLVTVSPRIGIAYKIGKGWAEVKR